MRESKRANTLAMPWITLASKSPLLDFATHFAKSEACRLWSHDVFTNNQHILLMLISVRLLDLVCDMAEERKKNCRTKSLKIILQKRWAVSLVQLGIRRQRSDLKITADEEYLQSSKQTKLGQLNWESYSQTVYQPPSLSIISYLWVAHPSSPPTEKIMTSWLWREKKKITWKWAIANRKSADTPKHQRFLENKPLWRPQ